MAKATIFSPRWFSSKKAEGIVEAKQISTTCPHVHPTIQGFQSIKVIDQSHRQSLGLQMAAETIFSHRWSNSKRTEANA
jgi:hypothetical protein